MAKKYRHRYNQRSKPVVGFFIVISKILAVLAVVALLVWGVVKFTPTEFLKVEVYWHIDKTLPITQAALADKIEPLIKDKYQLDLQQIKHALEAEPWVNNAHISRLFWNSIQVKIVAHHIAMGWQNTQCKSKKFTDCKGYISDTGVLFMPKKLIPSAHAVAISKQDKEVVFKLYQDHQRYQIIASPLPIQSFSRTHIDQLIFKSGVKVILGYQQQNERLSKFIKAYNKLKNKNSKVKRATFDMRYPKGFALSYERP